MEITKADLDEYKQGARLALLSQIQEELKRMEKQRQVPLAEKVMDRIYATEVSAYNFAFAAVSNYLKELE